MKTFITTTALLLFSLVQIQAQTTSCENKIETFAFVEDSTVFLTWKLNREVNTDYFVIERAVNGAGFQTIATEDAKGYTVHASSYDFEDAEFSTEAGYRVVLVTMDGQRIASQTLHLSQSSAVANAPAR
ncbi:MAG: hypothetical protein RLP15_04585 [Cryomorphaceae bacterium]